MTVVESMTLALLLQCFDSCFFGSDLLHCELELDGAFGLTVVHFFTLATCHCCRGWSLQRKEIVRCSQAVGLNIFQL